MNSKLMTFLSCFAILFSTFSCVIRHPEKHLIKVIDSNEKFDAVIVPGHPLEDGEWSNVTEMRMVWVKYLWDQGLVKNIIFSGGAVYNQYAECKVMKLYALEMGIPAQNIFMDSLAEHSTENVFYSTLIAKENGLKTIALASDPYQTKNLKAFLKKMERKTGYDIQILPAIIDTLATIEDRNYSINPEKAIGSKFVDITNTQSLGYRLKGTMGLRIDWELLAPVQ